MEDKEEGYIVDGCYLELTKKEALEIASLKIPIKKLHQT